MYELEELFSGGTFASSEKALTRIAFVHRSFRAIDKQRSTGRKAFGSHFPPLGLLNLARSLRCDAEAGVIVLPQMRVFDEEFFIDEADMFGAIYDWLENAERRIVAASTYTNTILELETFFSRFDPRRSLLIVGGAHVTLSPEFTHAHLLVRGEGGAALRHILRHIGRPDFGQGSDALGICYIARGEHVLSRAAFDRSLEVLPSPSFDYSLLPTHHVGEAAYTTNITRMLGDRPQIYVCTQSCRARCTFCSTYMIHGKSKSRPVHLIAEDLNQLVRVFGHDTIEFHDDDLLQHNQLDALLDLLRDIATPWFCFARVETIDEKMAAKLANAGCKRVFLGVESMNQAVLDYYNKGTTVAQNQTAVRSLAAAGIGVVAGFIIGSPDDTVTSILDMQDQYLELPLYGISCSILSPDPNTLEFARARRRGGAILSVLSGNTGRSVKPNIEQFGAAEPAGLPTVCSAVSKVELNALVALIEAEFYYRPSAWEALRADRHEWQIRRIVDYYDFLANRIAQLDVTTFDRRIGERRQRILKVVNGGSWRI